MMVDLLGGSKYEGVAFTSDQTKSFARTYGFDLVKAETALTAAGNQRNLMRLVERDGMRVMGLLSRHLEEGEDPVRLVAEALAALGFDIMIPDEETSDETET